MKRLGMVVLLVLLAGAVARPAVAQARFGAQVSWADDVDFGLGARLGFPLGVALKRQGIEGLVAFDFFFPDAYDYWELSANGLYHFTPQSTTKPYVGAGLLVSHASPNTPGASNTDLGLNLIGGLRFKAQPRLLPFVEGRLELKDESQFVLTAGVYFGKP